MIMARYDITYEEVAKVASMLIQQRQIPTVENVQKALDDTEINPTILKHLNTWQKQYFENQPSHEKTVEVVQEEELLQQTHTGTAKKVLEREETLASNLESDLIPALQSEVYQDHQQKNHTDNIYEWKALAEKQRTGFMVKIEELRTVKEKLEKENAKLATELQQQAIRLKDIQERNRALETDLGILRKQKDEAEKQVVTLKEANDHKENVINFFKDIYDGWKQAMEERETVAYKEKESEVKSVKERQ